MIDLAAYDLRPLSERLRGIRTARDFRERRALLEAVASGAPPEAAGASPARSSQLARTPANGLPYSGPRAPSSGAGEKLEDEWALRRPGSGRGGEPAIRPAPRFPPGVKPSSAEAASSGSSGPAASIAAKAGLAAGSQAAVVKLASYGSGSARAASLLNYQSDKGQLTLEREDGTLVTGKAAVDDLAAHWREDDAREPSNDVFRVTLHIRGQARFRGSAGRPRGRPRRPSLRLEARGARRLHARASRRCRRRRAQRRIWKEGADLRQREISSLLPRQDRGRLRPRRRSLWRPFGRMASRARRPNLLRSPRRARFLRRPTPA